MSIGGSRTTRDVRPDTSSFTDFYRHHVTRVTALAVTLSNNRMAADDVVQEAFSRAFRDWDRIAGHDDPGAWVRKVAVNLARSRWRRLRTETRAIERLGAQAREACPEMPEPSAEIWRAVRQLPRRQAIAIALHYVDGLRLAEVAEFTGVAEGTTKSDLHHARRKLRKLLEQEQTP